MWYFSFMPKPAPADGVTMGPAPPNPVRAAFEAAKGRPLPPPEERARLLAVAAETGKGTMTLEELQAKLAARGPAAAE
jgi:hypothetical protein